MIVPLALVQAATTSAADAADAGYDPDDPVACLEHLARAERVRVTDLALVAMRPVAPPSAGEIAARVLGARATELRRLAALERLGIVEVYVRDRLRADVRATYVEPLAGARASERAALREAVRAALEPYRPHLPGGDAGPGADPLAALTAS
jgi:hypothetical protein